MCDVCVDLYNQMMHNADGVAKLPKPCMCCGKTMFADENWYMLEDIVWHQCITTMKLQGKQPEEGGYLCLDCVAKLLGRPVCQEDFSNAPVNWDSPFGFDPWRFPR